MKEKIMRQPGLLVMFWVTLFSITVLPCGTGVAHANDTTGAAQTETQKENVPRVENTASEEEIVVLPDVVLSEKKTPSEVNKADLNVLGGGAQLNPYTAISTQPGVDIRFTDGYGMTISHKIRGKSDRNIGETLEGMPLKGIGPGGGLSTMMDMENLESISVEKGPVTVDSGLGYGSDNGMVDMHILQPKEDIGVLAKQAVGTDSFTRSFLRLDSGNVGDIARVFVSGSYTDAEKWKGKGNSPDGRINGAFGLSSPDDHAVQWNIYGVYNDEQKHNYRSMTYEQSKDLSQYYGYDYNTELTGIPAQDSSYYDFNRSDFTTCTLLGKLKVPVTFIENSSLTFRPYFLRDKGHSYSGSGTTVIDWLVEHDTYGGVLEYSQSIGPTDMKIGYWYGEDEPPGPPTSKKKWDINTDGTLSFNSWERLLEATDNSHFNSPYISVDMYFERFSINAGIRYLWWTTPSLTSYNTTGIGDGSYEDALAQATTIDFHVDGKTYEVFLPRLGMAYQLSDSLSLNAVYGRNYNTPQYGIGSSLVSYFKKGKTQEELQNIWNQMIQPEESDNFDIGMKLKRDKFSLDTTLFYSLSKHTAGTYYDEALGEAYNQNVGEARSYGAEMMFGYTFFEGLQANLALTYNKYEFTDDFFASNGSTVIHAEGNQIPETPLFMANMSMSWKIGDITVSPIVRYLGKRYADVENKYSLDDCYLVDLDISWELFKKKNRPVTLRLSATNLLDKKYIAKASARDQSTEISGLSFSAGSPRAIVLSIQFEM